MTALAISLLEDHYQRLQRLLFSREGYEHAAYVIFGAASASNVGSLGTTARLLVSHAVLNVAEEAALKSSAWEVSWQTSDVIQKLKIATTKNLTLGIVHNHNGGDCQFSTVDDQNESDLIRTIQNRNGPRAQLASLLFTPDGRWSARLWTSPTQFVDATELRTIGDRFKLSFANSDPEQLPPFLDRQSLALGESFTRQLKSLRVAIVGCGGTGSATATLLARLGVGAMTLIDDDVVEESNLNRLHGATRADVQLGKTKVQAVSESIERMGLQSAVTTHRGWVSDKACRDLLKNAHVVFGCTDDHAGRILLNRFAYAYQIPVVDMGLAIELSSSRPPVIQAMDGRVTVLVPGQACLLCRGVIDTRRAREESLKRIDPHEYERRKLEAYVIGEGEPSPAVVTFTTELACMAVNEVIHRLQGYRGEHGSTANRVRFFHRMTDLRPSQNPDPECRVCGQPTNWCRGDTEPFLGIVG